MDPGQYIEERETEYEEDEHVEGHEEANRSSDSDGSSSSAPVYCRLQEPKIFLDGRFKNVELLPKRGKHPNKVRSGTNYKVPRPSNLKQSKVKRAGPKNYKVPLRKLLNVPYLQGNPFVGRLTSVDGASSVKEAAALTTWSTIEAALLILNYFEAKKNELTTLRTYTCQEIVSSHFADSKRDKAGTNKSFPSEDDNNRTEQKPWIPMEYSMFYNYQFSNPLFFWPYEKDFNLFVGLRAIDEYIQLRLNWMKHTNFGISYDHFETDESSVNHIYTVVGCNMRSGYPIGQTTFNLIFVIVCKHQGSDPMQRVSARFFIEGNPTEFVPMYNDHLFTERLVRVITNRKIRYFSKFHLTDSLLRKEHTTEQQAVFKKRLMKNYRKAFETNAALSSKNTVSIPVYSTLCGFCISFDGRCALHKHKCHWDELFSADVAAKSGYQSNRELDNTIKRHPQDVFWPDVKKPIKDLFDRKLLLW